MRGSTARKFGILLGGTIYLADRSAYVGGRRRSAVRHQLFRSKFALSHFSRGSTVGRGGAAPTKSIVSKSRAGREFSRVNGVIVRTDVVPSQVDEAIAGREKDVHEMFRNCFAVDRYARRHFGL